MGDYKYHKGKFFTIHQRTEARDGKPVGEPWVELVEGYTFDIFDDEHGLASFGIYRHPNTHRYVITCLETGRCVFTGRPAMPRDNCVDQFRIRYLKQYLEMRSGFVGGFPDDRFDRMREEYERLVDEYKKGTC